MKRLLQIGKELNVKVSILVDYSQRLGHTWVTRNSKVDSQLENQLADIENGIIEIPPRIEKDEFQVSSTSELPSDFNNINPFSNQQKNIIQEDSQFSNRQKRTLIFKDLTIETVFSDFEAYSICSGLSNKHAKHMARNYFKKNKNIEEEKIEVHSIAMNTLEKYGYKTLLFIVSLPPLPFKALDATQIFNELDKRREKQYFPILRITYKNDKNQTEKIQVSYFVEKMESGCERNDNVLAVINRSTGKQIMRVSRNGIVIPERNVKQIIPILQVFIRFSQNTKQTLLNYGLETGECSVCGRELTDDDSIRRGVGPVCKEYIN